MSLLGCLEGSLHRHALRLLAVGVLHRGILRWLVYCIDERFLFVKFCFYEFV